MAYMCTWANMGLSMINPKANTRKNVTDSMFFVLIQMDGPLDAEKKRPQHCLGQDFDNDDDCKTVKLVSHRYRFEIFHTGGAHIQTFRSPPSIK